MSKSMTRMAGQRGMGMLGFITLVGLVAFFLTIALKVGPTYMNFWTVRTIMKDMADGRGDVIVGGARGIADILERRMDVNSVVYPTMKEFDIKKIEGGTYRVTLNFDQRVHLFFNVDAVTMFKYQVDIETQ